MASHKGTKSTKRTKKTRADFVHRAGIPRIDFHFGETLMKDRINRIVTVKSVSSLCLRVRKNGLTQSRKEHEENPRGEGKFCALICKE